MEANLSQPDFEEEGHKTPKSRVIHRLAGTQLVAHYLPPISYQLTDLTASGEVHQQKDVLLESLRDVPEDSAELILENMIFLPKDIFLRAGPGDRNYADRWGRDVVYTLMGLEDPGPLSYQIRKYTEGNHRANQTPTRQFFGSDRELYNEDETTAVVTFGRTLGAARGDSLTKTEKEQWQKRVDWIAKHFVDGFYETPAGKNRSWFDLYKFPAGTVSYTHMVSLAALIGADQQSLKVDPNILMAAIKAARQESGGIISASGYLQLEKSINHRDISPLMGEHLANMLGENILPPSVVHETVQNQPKVGHGLANITT